MYPEGLVTVTVTVIYSGGLGTMWSAAVAWYLSATI